MEPSLTDWGTLLTEQNPWLVPGKFVAPPHYRRSLQTQILRQLLAPTIRRFEVIVGPRRVGKSTLMLQVVQDLLQAGIAPIRIAWLRLDHPMLESVDLGHLVRSSIKTATDHDAEPTLERPLFVFLDEVLFARQWTAWLKTFYDDNWPVRVVATGSATAALLRGNRESGVGRWREWHLPPLQFHEYLRLRGANVPGEVDPIRFLRQMEGPTCDLSHDALMSALRLFVLVGGFPETAVGVGNEADAPSIQSAQERLRVDSVERAIYRDLVHAYDIRHPRAVERLAYLLADAAGSQMVLDNLANVLDLQKNTVETYLKYLEEAGLVFVLQNYSSAEEGIQRRGRKVFLTDAALRTAILSRGTAPLHDPAELGRLYETAVAAHLNAYCRANHFRLFHWREHNHEVDMIVGHPSQPTAFEVTASSQHTLGGLRRLIERFPVFKDHSWLISPSGVPQDYKASEFPSTIKRASLAQWLLACGLASDAAVLQAR